MANSLSWIIVHIVILIGIYFVYVQSKLAFKRIDENDMARAQFLAELQIKTEALALQMAENTKLTEQSAGESAAARAVTTSTLLTVAKDTEAIKGHVNSEKTASDGREAMLRAENALLREMIADKTSSAALLAQSTAMAPAASTSTISSTNQESSADVSLKKIDKNTAAIEKNTAKTDAIVAKTAADVQGLKEKK